MRLETLRNFVAIAEEGNLSRAARRRHVAQPAVSAQISRLEAELGAALFRRSRRGMALTPAGEILLTHARAMLDGYAAARREIAALGPAVAGEVSVALPGVISVAIAPQLLRVLAEVYPALRLRLQEGYSLECRERIETASVDLAILPEPDAAAGVVVAPLYEQAVFLVGARENRYGRDIGEGDIPFAQAAAFPLVLPARPNALRVQLDAIARAEGVGLNVVREGDLDLNHIVAGGTAFSLRPWLQIRDRVERGTLAARRIVAPEVRRRYVLCRPRARPLSEAAAAVAEEIRRIAALLPGQPQA